MAEINRSDLWADDAITAPLQYAKNVKEAIKEMDALLASGKKLGESLQAANTISKLTEETNKLSKAQKDLEGVQKTVSAQMNDRYKQENKNLDELVKRRAQLSSLIKGNLKDQKEDLKLLKEGVINRKEYNKRLDESNVNIAKYKAQIQSLNKNVKDEIALNSTLGNQYQKLVIQLEQARTTYKNMAASGTVASNVLKEQAKIVTDLNAKIVTIDKAVGQFQRNVGNYPGTFGAAAGALKDFLGAFGIVTGLALFAKALKEIVSLNVEFAFKNSELQGILGATADETKKLRDQQVELGKTTLYTATQYTQLQIELSKLGFPIDAINKMTESTANAALAMGADLGRQAELTGSVLHSFQLDAARTEEVNDLLAKSTAASALSFESLATTLPYVSASANALGFSLSETLALMGQLSNNGLAASTVGTSLRSIFLKLADSSSALSKKFKEPIRDLPSLLKGLKQLDKEGTDLGEALELTDVRSVNAFKALINGADAVEKLNKTIADGNIEDFAKQLALIRSDNLKSDFTLLTAATSALAREVGEELDGAFRAIVQTLTRFVTVIAQIPKFIKDNRGLILSLVVAILAFNAAAIQTNATLLKKIALEKLDIIWTNALNISTKRLWATFALNPLGIVLASLAAVIAAISIYDKNSKRSAELAIQRKKLNEDLGGSIDRLVKAQQNLTFNEKEWERQSANVRKENLKRLEQEIVIGEFELKRAIREKDHIANIARELTLSQKLLAVVKDRFGIQSLGLSFAEEGQNNVNEATGEYNEKIQELRDLLAGLQQTQTNLYGFEEELNKRRIQNNKDQQKALYDLLLFRKNTELKFQEEIFANDKNSTDERIRASERAEKLRVEIIDLERKKELIDTKQFSEQVKLINEKAENDKYNVLLAGFKERGLLTKAEMQRDLALREDQFKKEIESAIRASKEFIDTQRNNLAEQFLEGRISRERYNKELIKIDQRGNELLLQNNINALSEQLLANEKFETERLLLATGDEKAILEIKKNASEEEKAILEKIQELYNQLQNARVESAKSGYEDEIENLQKIQSAYEDWSQGLGNLFDSLTERRLANIDLQERRLEEQTAHEIALAGDNDEAKKRIENDAEVRRAGFERLRIAEARKAAQREKAAAIISAGIQTSLAVLNALSTVKPYPAAVVAAISAGVLGAIQIAAIAAKPIPQFEKGGTTTTGTIIAGEKGAELYTTPSGETGLTPDTATIMNLPVGTKITPADETTRMLAMAGLRTYDNQPKNNKDSAALLKEIKSLKKVIKNKKEVHFNMSQKGAEIMFKNAETRTRFINDHYK